MIRLMPSHITLDNADTRDLKFLDSSLGIWDPVYHRISFRAYKIQDNVLYIPKGVGRELLLNKFPNEKVIDCTDKVPSYANSIDPYKLTTSPRNLKQQNALNFLTGETDYFSYARDFTQKMLCLITGDGKTFCTIAYASLLQVPTLIFVDMEYLIEQWYNSIKQFSDLPDERISIIQGGKSIDKLLKNKSPKHAFHIASYRTFSNMMENNEDKVKELFNHLKIGCKVYDEAHVEWDTILNLDLMLNVKSNLYLTATPGRSDVRENKLYETMYTYVPSFGLEHGYRASKKYHKVIFVKYDTHPTTDEVMNMNNNYGFNINAYSDYLMEDNRFEVFTDMLMKNICDLLDKKPELKIAVMVHKIDFAKKLQLFMEECGLLNKYNIDKVGMFNSAVNKKDKSKELASQIFITTDKSFDKAIDVPDLNVLINTVPIRSSIKIEQIMGRVRQGENKVCIYMHVFDYGFKSYLNQFKQISQFINNKAKKLYEIDMR